MEKEKNPPTNLAEQIHPDDLKRLADASRQLDVSTVNDTYQPPLAKLRPHHTTPPPSTPDQSNGNGHDLTGLRHEATFEQHDYWDENVEVQLEERKLQREERRRRAQQRLMTQKRRNLAQTGDILILGQIILLVFGIILERMVRDLARYKRAFDRQPARVRGLELIAVATVIMLVVALFFATQVKAYIDSKRGPFLEEALASPFELNAESTPFIDDNGAIVLPDSFAGYNLIETKANQGSLSQLNRCLLGLRVAIGADQQAYCTRTYGATHTAYGRYMSANNTPIDVIATRFQEVSHADQTLSELLRYTRSVSQVGNFSLLDDDEPDYFYGLTVSDFHRWLTFAWRQGNWIYMISAQSYDEVEKAVAVFPY